MALRLGFVVNPVAGIGGPAALKGSDGVVDVAAEAGYEPNAEAKATRFLVRLAARATPQSVRIFAAPGVLGSAVCRAAGWKVGTLGAEMHVLDPYATSAADTMDAARECIGAEMDLVVFVGGDGTARDVATAIGTKLPALGVPAGVKMFSECFAETPEAAADLVAELARPPFDEGQPLDTREADVLDLDEEAYRRGTMKVLHQAALRVPRSPRVQAAKCPACPPEGLESAVGEILSRMEAAPENLYVIGAGSTTAALKEALGVEGSLIGVDAVRGTRRDDAVAWTIVARDADRRTIESLVQDARGGAPVVLVLSPIGGQGFVFGRGTAQIPPALVHAALPDRLWIIATAGKLGTIEDGRLRVDTGDADMDRAFPPFLRVVVGAGRERMMPVARAAP